MHTFSHIIVHHEFQVFTTPDHSHGMPLIVVQLLAGVQGLGALAWEWWLVSLNIGVSLQTQYLLCSHLLKSHNDMYIYLAYINVHRHRQVSWTQPLTAISLPTAHFSLCQCNYLAYFQNKDWVCTLPGYIAIMFTVSVNSFHTSYKYCFHSGMDESWPSFTIKSSRYYSNVAETVTIKLSRYYKKVAETAFTHKRSSNIHKHKPFFQ